jgi:hypothetical protein
MATVSARVRASGVQREPGSERTGTGEVELAAAKVF